MHCVAQTGLVRIRRSRSRCEDTGNSPTAEDLVQRASHVSTDRFAGAERQFSNEIAVELVSAIECGRRIVLFGMIGIEKLILTSGSAGTLPVRLATRRHIQRLRKCVI